MAVTKVLARKWKFEIEQATPNTYYFVKGITDFDLPAPEGTEAETTDFDTDGWDDFTIVSRMQQLTLNGQRLEDAANGARDPGQERLEVLGRGVGTAAEAKFRITTPGLRLITGTVAVTSAGGGGGGSKDVSSWSSAVKFKGQPTWS